MAKVRDINDESEPTQSCYEKVAAAGKNCCETLAGWELWKKILLGFGIVSALTLVITLPIVLTGNETSVNPDGNTTTVAGSTGLFTTTLAADSTTRESTTTANASQTTMATSITTSAATSTTTETTTTTTATSTANSLSTTSSMTTGSLTTTTVMTTSLATTAGATSVITTTVAATTTAITTSGFQTTTLPTVVPTVVPQPPPYIGWGEWLEWSGCTVSCGLGQRSRLRLCSDGNGGFGDENDCPGDGFNSEECSNGKCLSGDKMVTGGYSRLKIQI